MLNLDLSDMELNRLTENNPHIKKVIENLVWFGNIFFIHFSNSIFTPKSFLMEKLKS